MNRNQQAYDRGTSLYSPDGRIYQVEYAREAVKRGAPSVGLRGESAVVLAARNRTSSALMETESVEKLHKLDGHVGAASAGHVADARQLVDYARRQAQVNRLRYGEPMGVESLAKEITDEIQESTQFGGTRPFGASLLVAGLDDDRARLFETDPSGTPHEWRAVAIGNDQAEVLEFLEEEYVDGLAVDDAVALALRALRSVADGDEFDTETVSVSTVTPEDGFRHLDDDEVTGAIEALPPAEDDADAGAGAGDGE